MLTRRSTVRAARLESCTDTSRSPSRRRNNAAPSLRCLRGIRWRFRPRRGVSAGTALSPRRARKARRQLFRIDHALLLLVSIEAVSDNRDAQAPDTCSVDILHRIERQGASENGRYRGYTVPSDELWTWKGHGNIPICEPLPTSE
ncbi:hypothetical protein BAUCODRAFT_473797 [Baudoinia panamericana UAMH 10762]|uniref:Uncharacterized protein n=1 Tax=Baudoinia panamericana (strain UAMH 10762) TaxID=717646 RepID=M2NBZ7_BAUPA|nr:uncharacterized protein BAUCODRAFT_473797 [Baudoinia panamericana UAMH 10762]EMC96410.1 hypothetical protein BAUCODRAFT_473797 [Baudoinia panamericana UAMH 10762]